MSARDALDRTIRLIRDAVDDTVPDSKIVAALQSFRVRCVCDRRNAEAYSGQTVIAAIASLVGRMGVQVDLGIPDVALVGLQPPLRGSRLVSSLLDFGRDLIPDSTITADPSLRADVTIAIGDTPVRYDAPGWRVSGGSWAGAMTPIHRSASRWSTESPIGGLTAAGLVAPEIFKAVIRRLPLRHPAWRELLKEAAAASWNFGVDAIVYPRDPVRVDIISAGAITQAALFTLLRTPVTLTSRIFDDDIAELGNLNRQLLYRRSDDGLKVRIVADAFSRPSRCDAIPETFTERVTSRFVPLASHVLVGVDSIPARWQVQRASGAWTGVGATSHFSASISSHEAQEGCAGCLHPRDDDAPEAPMPTVSFVSFWAGLTLAVRFLRSIGGAPFDRTHQNLWLSTLRLDNRDAAWWHRVVPRGDCPVQCPASRSIRAA